MVHGTNACSAQLLALLGLSSDDFGRYRDIRVEDGYIVVHTRLGGRGNRTEYCQVYNTVKLHEWYSHNHDCPHDTTYSDIYFKIPETEVKSYIGLLDAGVDPAKKWTRLLNTMKRTVK